MRIERSGSEFKDFKVALVDGEEFGVSIFKSIAASTGIHNVVAYASPKAAIGNIGIAGAPDILFVKFSGANKNALQLCRLIRDRETFSHPFMPVVAIMEEATVASVTAVRDAGVDEFLACPFSPKALGERVRSIVHDRRGFLDLSGYFGPDRRRGAMAKWLGVDRRSEPGPLIDPVTEQPYIG
ncbi:response regulator [Microbaculum sp. FT89]|uniref:response regulator n=1 Tax=Microbaculum sp. FT89 TaxID=3447298 RepID=UPI003F52D5B5